MNRGQRMGAQVIVALIGIALVVVALVALYWFDYTRIDYSAINHIKELQIAPNNFSDLSGDIGVSSVDDIGYKIEGDYNLSIYYGKQVIKVPPTAFKSEDFRKRLKEIGIEMFHHVNEDGSILYRVTYWGEATEEYSLVE